MTHEVSHGFLPRQPLPLKRGDHEMPQKVCEWGFRHVTAFALKNYGIIHTV